MSLGFHSWITYSLVGILLGVLVHRENLPLCISSCLWPLIGNRIYGWVGDLVQTSAVVTTLLAVCSKAGYNVKYLNDGMAAAGFVAKDDLNIQVGRDQ